MCITIFVLFVTTIFASEHLFPSMQIFVPPEVRFLAKHLPVEINPIAQHKKRNCLPVMFFICLRALLIVVFYI